MSDYLPEELEQVTVSALQDGETGYTFPSAVHVEDNGLSWIRGDYPVFSSPTEKATFRIRRDGHEIFAAKDKVGDYRPESRVLPLKEWNPLPLIWE